MTCQNCLNIKKVHIIKGAEYTTELACRDGKVLTEHDLTVERPIYCPITACERDALRDALRAVRSR